eukprot:TRINITY_DN6579_c0_g1_i12.p2 TRINITY_DN6579_c0_g1~~TRINITY_DN6579_c0_g1_i12.p2  ORF type:complete len:182 (-),score=34.32 TRINITY_DN6579_c0_g1_i12:133-678(-)
MSRMSITRHEHEYDGDENVEVVVDRFFKEQYGIDSNEHGHDDEDHEHDDDHDDDHHHGHHHGNFSCSAECDGKEADFSVFQSCSDNFVATCDIEMDEFGGKSHLECKGEYNGDWKGEACLGKYTFRMEAHKGGFHMACHEDYGSLTLYHPLSFGYIDTCHGFSHAGSGAEHKEAGIVLVVV